MDCFRDYVAMFGVLSRRFVLSTEGNPHPLTISQYWNMFNLDIGADTCTVYVLWFLMQVDVEKKTTSQMLSLIQKKNPRETLAVEHIRR